MLDNLKERIETLGKPRILVVGDLILERDVIGEADRSSLRDGNPVAHLRSSRRVHRLGGAGRLAMILRSLGADVRLIAGLGNDSESETARELLEDAGIDDRLVVVLDDRPTVLKEQFLVEVKGQSETEPVFKVDHESFGPIPSEAESFLWHHLAQAVAESDLVMISDLDHGICSSSLLRSLITVCRTLRVRVIGDPSRSTDLSKFEGVHALVTTRLEAQLATGLIVRKREDGVRVGRKLLDELKMECAIVTLDRSGMAVVPASGKESLIAGRVREVFDRQETGQSVFAVLGICLAAGADYQQAAMIANLAGGPVVDKPGSEPIRREDLMREIDSQTLKTRNKEYSLEGLLSEVAKRRETGQKVVFTNGCFDLIHPGHVRLLREAASLGDFLIVGVNSDDSTSRLKGPTRPINAQDARVEVLEAMECVDAVIVFDADTPIDLIRAILPDVLVKGGDYAPKDVVGRDVVEKAGGRLVLVTLFEGHSTTKIIHGATKRTLTLHPPSAGRSGPMSQRPKKPTEKKPKP